MDPNPSPNAYSRSGSLEVAVAAAPSPRSMRTFPRSDSVQSPAHPISSKHPVKASSSRKPVPAKPSQQPLRDITVVPAFEANRQIQRNSYGDARAAREDEMGASMAAIAQSKGLIEDETAKNWATPCHITGQIQLKWSEQTISRFNAENGIASEAVMSLEEAKARKRNKDRELEDWVCDFKAGKIDENGSPIGLGGETSIMRSKSLEPDTRRRTTTNETIASGYTSDRDSESDSDSCLFQERRSPETTTTTTTQPAGVRPKKIASKVVPSAPHREDRPDYAEFNYSQCAAICEQRSICSGGNVQTVRNRLMHDDMLVDTNQIHLREYAFHSRSRPRQTQPPVVDNAPDAGPAEDPGKRTKHSRHNNEDEGNEQIDHHTLQNSMPI